MSVWKLIVTAIVAVAATHIDEVLMLDLYFSQAGPALKRWHIITDPLVEFTGLVAISLLGFAFSFLLPGTHIGQLGGLSTFLGLRTWFSREGRAASKRPGGQ